jgi:hypothetical protein
VLTERPALGTACLFPASKNAAKPVDRWFASKWLETVERLAEVPKHDASLWHAYRRKWGTERKHLPIQDVAQAGARRWLHGTARPPPADAGSAR